MDVRRDERLARARRRPWRAAWVAVALALMAGIGVLAGMLALEQATTAWAEESATAAQPEREADAQTSTDGVVTQAPPAGVTVTRPQERASSQATDEAEASEEDTGTDGRPAEPTQQPEEAKAQAQAQDEPQAGQQEGAQDPQQDSPQEETGDTPEAGQAGSPVDVEAGMDAGVLVVEASGLPGPAALRVTLPDGVKPQPGAYASGTGVSAATALLDGGRTVIEARVEPQAGAATLRLLLMGQPSGEGGAVEVSLLDEQGAQLAGRLVEVAPAAALARARSGESAQFTTSGYYDNTSTPTTNRIPQIVNAGDGSTAYCNDIMLAAPGDPAHGSSEPVWYQRWYFPSDPAQAAAQGKNLLDYVLFHGHPTDPTIGGICSDPQDAECATQWAIWNFTNPGHHPSDEAPPSSWSDEFWWAYDALVAGAIEYDAQCAADPSAFRPERDTCVVWSVDAAGLQNVLTARPNYGWIDLAKSSADASVTDGDAAYSLAGATFEVRDAAGGVQATLVTDEAGTASALVPVGTYDVVETVAPPGFMLDPTSHGVTVAGGPVHVTLSVQDQPVRGEIRIVKSAGAEQGSPLAGARFAVISQASGQEVATLLTGQDGTASTGAVLSPGTYLVREAEAPDGYAPAADVTVTVGAGEELIELNVVDPYATRLTVRKTDAAAASDLAGARLQLLDDAGEVVDEWVSDGTPHLIEGLAPGAYVVHEVEAPPGYAPAADVEFELAPTSAEQSVTLPNERSLVPFSFLKTDALTCAGLAGALFSLYEPVAGLPEQIDTADVADGSTWALKGTATSSEGGLVDFGELETGTYLLVETQAPAGYQHPAGGWLVTLQAGTPAQVSSVGRAPAFETADDSQDTPRLANSPLPELPRAGGSGQAALPQALGPWLLGASALGGVAVAASGRPRRAGRPWRR